MKRLDLIIDALESCKETSWSMTFDAESVQEALAAARELREVNQELLEALTLIMRAELCWQLGAPKLSDNEVRNE